MTEAVKNNRSLYTKRFSRVLDYIEHNLEKTLSVEELAGVAHFSRFHFQRQFSEHVGMTVNRYIQLLRLRRASYQLVFMENRLITDIAFDAGFENSESFSRAFKHRFGQTPSHFRTLPAWEPWNKRLPLPERTRRSDMNVKIIDFAETQVAALEHHGSPDKVMESVQVFIEWRKQSGLSPIDSSRTFGIIYHDPASTPADEFRFDICGEVDGPIPDNTQGVTGKQLEAGRCAVVRHEGSLARVAESIYPIYREWLPDSGEELRDFPMFFHYLKRVPEVDEHEQITDIYLPLKSSTKN